jgi:hypothetical protein
MQEIAEARRIVSCYLRRFGRFPVDLLATCRAMKITLRVTRLDDFDGCYLRLGGAGRTLILLNKATRHHRRRFSLAHELGHLILRHPPAQFIGGCFIEARQRWQEIQANRFAAELLMPAPALLKMGPMCACEIAERFDVSLQAAEYKAQEMGWIDKRKEIFWGEQIAAQLEAMGL